MVMRNPVSLASKCSSCHHSASRRFISFAGIPFRPATKPSTVQLTFSRKQAFTIANTRGFGISQQATIQPLNGEVDAALDAAHITPAGDTLEPASPLPWYLQVETPSREQSPLSERQELPELPPDPPPLLLPILEYISTDLGLDDLYLFDLRQLNPPPALGANLIMILGTARSEKHLHISADRFCRWLRSTHKLRPQADGLMGRGELKLKMRRKARRARLLSSVGSSDRTNQDDGLSTGWICVNVGPIEDGESASEFHSEADAFVGFGEQDGGARVVIQMLTQEKREDLDLEELWGNVLEKQLRRSERGSDSFVDTTDVEEVGQNSRHEQKLSSNLSTIVLSGPQKPSMRNSQQRRGLHNRVRRLGSEYQTQESVFHQSLDYVKQERDLNPGTNSIVHKINTKSAKGEGERGDGRTSDHSSEFETDGLETFNPKTAKVPPVRAHLRYLYDLSREDAVEALGNGIKDFGSTPFLSSLYRSIFSSSRRHQWDYRIAIACYAIEICHPKYDKRKLIKLFDEMRASTINIRRKIFMQVVNTLISSPKNAGPDSAKSTVRIYEIHQAIILLEDMASRGLQPYGKILLPLYAAVAQVNASGSKYPPRLRSDATARLRLLLDQYGFEHVEMKTHLDLLNAFADGENWKGFWAHWRGIARRMQPKEKELYMLMFHRLGQTGHQSNCMDALRTWLPEMEQEEPVVTFRDVANEVMECLRVAEPSSENEFVHGIIHPGNEETEWVRLWRRCDQSIRDTSTIS